MKATDIPTEPLLTPTQLENMTEERNRLQSMLNAPPHIRNAVQDKNQVRRQLANLTRQLEKSTPRPFEGQELDEAVRLERDLREQITSGMCTQREMRGAPPGAVDKHRMWQTREKDNTLRWKNLRRRLHASGVLQNTLPDATDIANIEMYRPRGGSHELPMDNSVTPTKDIHVPLATHPAVVMNDKDMAALKAADPELYDALPTLTNEQRAAIRAILRGEAVEQSKPKKQKRNTSPEAREAARQRMLKYHAEKRAEKENGGRSDDNDLSEQREQAGPEVHE